MGKENQVKIGNGFVSFTGLTVPETYLQMTLSSLFQFIVSIFCFSKFSSYQELISNSIGEQSKQLIRRK